MAVLHRIAARLGPAPARACALGLLAGTVLSIAGAPAPAQARVEKVPIKGGGPEVTVGLQPREAKYYWDASKKLTGLGTGATGNAGVASFGNSEGHEVVHVGAVNTYAIYWDPSDYYHGDWQGLVDEFLANLGESNGALSTVFAVDGQYTDTTNKPAASRSRFRGAYTDTHPYPDESGNCIDPHAWEFGVPLLENSAEKVCLTDAQVKAELARFIKQREEEHVALSKGMGTIFYLLTPPGVTVCLDEGGENGHCSDFHGTTQEVEKYEEAEDNYPEQKEKYEEEKATYEKEHAKYEKEKKNYETEGKEDPNPAPVAPVAPVVPTEPSGYEDYKKSFCSYHGVIGSGSTAILYGMIPWTAGGDGDPHLAPVDQTSGYACQDGGFEPQAKPSGEIEEKEREKPESVKEKEELEEAPAKKKEEHDEAVEDGLAKPHDQEPHQLAGVGPDGGYDHGLSDLIINQIAVEQQNIVTDPLLNGWKDTEGNEATDECRNLFVPVSGSASANQFTKAGSLANQVIGDGSYYINEASTSPRRSVPSGQRIPGASVPGSATCRAWRSNRCSRRQMWSKAVNRRLRRHGVRHHARLGGQTSRAARRRPTTRPTPGTSATPSGDATRKSAATRQARPPVKTVAEHVRSERVPHLPIRQAPTKSRSPSPMSRATKPPPRVRDRRRRTGPETPGSSSSAADQHERRGAGGRTAPAPSASGTTAASGALAATATIASKTLPSVLRSGLAIRYSVNEQVAGHFEVLLAASIAQRVGLHGSDGDRPGEGHPAADHDRQSDPRDDRRAAAARSRSSSAR